MVTIEEITTFFFYKVYLCFRLYDKIISNHGPQFTSAVMIPHLALFFFLGLPFRFTDDTSIFTNHLILLYNYPSPIIMITPPSDVIT